MSKRAAEPLAESRNAGTGTQAAQLFALHLARRVDACGVSRKMVRTITVTIPAKTSIEPVGDIRVLDTASLAHSR